MGALISRKEALGILGVTRARFEALVDVGAVTRVCPPMWRKGLYRRDEVIEALGLLEERKSGKND